MLVGVGASTAGAQVLEESGPPRALLIEAEVLGGYTPVEMEKWTRTRPSTSNQASYGLNVRAYLFFINKIRVGVELGNQHFFTWERQAVIGSTFVKETNSVAGFRFGIAVRACETARMDCNVGYGFNFLGEDALPAVNFGMNYLLLKRRRFSVPIGARIDLLLGDAYALPVALKTGITFKP